MKITKSGIIQKSHMYDEDTNYYFAANGTVNDIYNTNNKDIYRCFDSIDTSVNNEGVFVSSWNDLTQETEGVRIKIVAYLSRMVARMKFCYRWFYS